MTTARLEASPRNWTGTTAALLHAGGLALLVYLTMGSIWTHAFVQDDMGVIFFNELAHRWDGVWRAFGEAYWPPIGSGELYRPLTISSFTVQWMLGGGAVWPFRAASLVLYFASTIALWRLLRDLVPPSAAWFGAALFAVHPVHVESVALAVNQSELLVGLVMITAIHWRVRALRGEVTEARAGAIIWALFVLGILTKEHALVLPGLLLATDLLLESSRESWRSRIRRWSRHYLLLFATGILFWMVRTSVLGPGAGTRTAEALAGLTIGGRALTMAGIPAEWLRLLLWPARLQGDWNLLEWVPTGAWSIRESAGVIALLSVGLAFVLAWRRRPLIAFGIAWMGIALAPVSNLLLPTGIILAERTLFAPSIGLALIVGDLAAPLVVRWPTLPRPGRLAATVVVALLLVLGTVQSAVRQTAWRTRPLFLATQLLDAPTSWKANLAYATLLSDLGDTAAARLRIRRAIALRSDAPIVVRGLADAVRYNEGKCVSPAIIYEELLERLPGRSDLRGALAACYLFLGRYADASARAGEGIARGLDPEYFTYVRSVADSSARAAAVPGTVRLDRHLRGFTMVGPVSRGASVPSGGL